jgi:hypothetical protein
MILIGQTASIGKQGLPSTLATTNALGERYTTLLEAGTISYG